MLHTELTPASHTPVTDLAGVRARHLAEAKRAHAVAFVTEHLDVLAVTVVMGHPVTNETLRRVAEQVVDGCYAIRTEAH